MNIHGLVYTIFFLCELKMSINNNPKAATVSADIWVSNAIFQYKEPGILREIADSWTERENIQDRPGACYSAEGKAVSPHQSTLMRVKSQKLMDREPCSQS